ncbi:hypothetical protein N7470_003946 [Penicillium chermesinum]|nr:hypothetical protein N7470_003946 [Penicillium chermesinum]
MWVTAGARALESQLPQPDVTVNSVDSLWINLALPAHSCDKYPAKQHARNVARKLGATHGLIFIAGQPTANWRDSDQEKPFRQRRYFYYLSGVNEPDCSLTYDVALDQLTLYIPDFDLHRAIWMGPTLSREDAQNQYDVDRVLYHSSLLPNLEAWLGERVKNSVLYLVHASEIPAGLPTELPLDSAQLLPAINAARAIKDDYEIRMIRHANEISGLAHRKVLEGIRKMANESEIEGLFLNVCTSNGARNQAYQIIAAFGPNAAVLHYSRNDDSLLGKPLVCLDAGAEWHCYASDVTRTFPPSGYWPSNEAVDIYEIVERMQEECIKRIRRGTRFRAVHELANDIAIEGLMSLGVLRGGSHHEINRHHVGLEVHDVSGSPIMAYDAGRVPLPNSEALTARRSFVPLPESDSLLEEGMVVTVEPGLYFSPLALANARKQPYAKYIDFEAAERYVPIGGVRIEDDILVTANGNENLTTAPKGDEALAIIRGHA